MTDVEPCWTGIAERGMCHRGGLGCPLPHPNDPPALRQHHTFLCTLDWNPLAYGIEYPRISTFHVCPEHGQSSSVGGTTWCPKCPAWKQAAQRAGLPEWVQHRRKARRALRQFMKELRAGPPPGR